MTAYGSPQELRESILRWRQIIAREVSRQFPAASPERAAVKQFVIRHSLTVANAFHHKIIRTDVIAELTRLGDGNVWARTIRLPE